MQSLRNDILEGLSQQGLDVPNYRFQKNTPKVGIVHLGPGAFFRGHQAWYTHKALAKAGGDWAICAVSMRSAGVRDALEEQQGLYAVAELDSETHYQIVGAVNEVLVANTMFEQVMERLTNKNTKFVSMTITEKGYCLNNDGELDLTSSEIIKDLTFAQQPTTAVGLLVSALFHRKSQGLAPFTVLSCDNITDNGHKLKAALVKYAQQFDQDLAAWIESKVISPCTMVDSITPATDDALRSLVAEKLKVQDNWPIKREAFLQWVIEDCLPADRPAWDEAGATFTSDVQGFENAKLRLLNCPHSTLAYIGVLLGLETVHDTMGHDKLVQLVELMINNEIIPSFTAPKELNVTQYSQDILARFKNPEIRHLVAQIAWDGSQKLPMRILPIIAQNIKDKRSIKLLSTAVIAWFIFLQKRYRAKETLVDPLADELISVAQNCTGDAAHDVGLLLTLYQVFPKELADSSEFAQALINVYPHVYQVFTEQELNWAALA